MSAVAGLFGEGAQRDLALGLEALRSGMVHRGSDVSDSASLPRAALSVQRHDWETPLYLAGAARVAQRGDVHVAADASIYYRADLRRELGARGVACPSDEPAELIAAAYEAFGDDCVLKLEGDYAFILFDGRDGRVVLGRDHVGRRPLHYAVSGGLLVAASTARAVAGHPAIRAPLNVPAIAAAVSGLLGGSTETGFVGVTPVPAGTTVEWRPERVPRVAVSWTAPEFRIGGRARLEEGAEQLRSLLVAAASERLGPSTAVWLSGGADSTAVFAAAQLSREGRMGEGRAVFPVTVSYPVGDSAREDEHVQAIASRWATRVTWVDSEGVRLLDDAPQRAAARDDPYAHTFEHVNRRLARTSAELGARVSFDGYGGDQLFHVSDAWLADLFVRLRWRELSAALRASRVRGVRAFVSACMVPWLPAEVYRAIQRLRGRDAADLLVQQLPSWLAPIWRDGRSLRLRTELEPARRFLESPAAYESRWYTQTPYFPRSVSWAAAIALEAGTDTRSPLLDRRLVEFAASRPLTERVAPGETKVLLRRAMEGLIPASVLAPRPTKTGIPRASLHRRLREELPQEVETLFRGTSGKLSDLGVIDLAAYRAALGEYLKTGDHITGVQLLLTFQCELWLRSLGAG